MSATDRSTQSGEGINRCCAVSRPRSLALQHADRSADERTGHRSLYFSLLIESPIMRDFSDAFRPDGNNYRS